MCVCVCVVVLIESPTLFIFIYFILLFSLSLFFELNDLPDTNRGVLWEASKAYIRGQLNSCVSNLKSRSVPNGGLATEN